MEELWKREADRENRGAGLRAVCRTVLTIAVLLFLYMRWAVQAQAADGDTCIRHVHVGNQDVCGGCYGEAVYCEGRAQAYSVTQQCGGRLTQKPYLDESGDRVVFVCGECGTYTWGYVPGYLDMWTNLTRCQNARTVEKYRCSICRTDVLTAESACTRMDHYVPDCGMEEGQVLAELCCVRSTDTWTRQMTLEGGIKGIQPGFDIRSELLTWSEEGASGETLEVTANGTYTMVYPVGEGYTGAQLAVQVTNIDRDAPLLTGITKRAVDGGITVSIQCSDEASGIAENGFSWDGGATWSGDDSRNYSENGTYQIMVRDRAGNADSMEFTVSGILPHTEPARPTDSSPAHSVDSSQASGGAAQNPGGVAQSSGGAAQNSGGITQSKPDAGRKETDDAAAGEGEHKAVEESGKNGTTQNRNAQKQSTQKKSSSAGGTIYHYSDRDATTESDAEAGTGEENAEQDNDTEDGGANGGEENLSATDTGFAEAICSDTENRDGQEIQLADDLVATVGVIDGNADPYRDGTAGGLLFFLLWSALGAGILLGVWYLIRRRRTPEKEEQRIHGKIRECLLHKR